MPASFDGKLVVAISSRALFDLEESNRVFEEQGVPAYYRYQLEHVEELRDIRARLETLRLTVDRELDHLESPGARG